MSNNKVQLTGNLGKDPEIKQFENGKRASFSLATTEEYKNRNGEKASDTQWHFIVGWGKVADRIESELKKGSFVTIEGRLANRSYVDKTGQKKYITEIVASDVLVKERVS